MYLQNSLFDIFGIILAFASTMYDNEFPLTIAEQITKIMKRYFIVNRRHHRMSVIIIVYRWHYVNLFVYFFRSAYGKCGAFSECTQGPYGGVSGSPYPYY